MLARTYVLVLGVALPLGLAAQSLPRHSAEGTMGQRRRPEQMGEVW